MSLLNIYFRGKRLSVNLTCLNLPLVTYESLKINYITNSYICLIKLIFSNLDKYGPSSCPKMRRDQISSIDGRKAHFQFLSSFAIKTAIEDILKSKTFSSKVFFFYSPKNTVSFGYFNLVFSW